MNTKTQTIPSNHPPLYRRLLSMLYDFIIVGVGFMLVSYILVKTLAGNAEIPPLSLLNNAIQTAGLALASLYFIVYWTKKGDTPGMWAWKLKIQQLSGGNITLSQAVIRYLSLFLIITAAVMTGYWLHFSSLGSLLLILLFVGMSLAWCIVDQDKLALHERLSKTRLVDTRTL